MPTMVERLLDSFLKIEGNRDPGLNQAFANIDGDLGKLLNANSDSFLQTEHTHAVQNDFHEIGDALQNVGLDFHKADTAMRLFDTFVTRAVGGGGGAGMPADLELADHRIGVTAADLRHAGQDFLRLTTSPNLETFDAKLHGVEADFRKAGGDMAADREAFLNLSADFLKLGGGSDANALLPAVQFGSELRTVAGDFGTLAADFLKLSDALAGSQGGGGAGTPGDPNASGGGGGAGKPVGQALMTLFQDFHTLGTDLGALGKGADAVLESLPHQTFLAGTHSHGGGGGAG